LPPGVAAEPAAGAVPSGEAVESAVVPDPGSLDASGGVGGTQVGGGEVVSPPVPCPLSVVLWVVPKRPPPRWSGPTAWAVPWRRRVATPPLALMWLEVAAALSADSSFGCLSGLGGLPQAWMVTV